MANILTSLCVFYNLPGPPSIIFQNGTYQLYPVNKIMCSQFDARRDTIFELYTRNNPTKPQFLRLAEDEPLENSGIDFQKPTIMFFHGFLESSRSDNAQQIKNNYLKRGDYNIILVNNERLLAGPYYLTAAANTEPIGKYTAKFVDYLVEKGLELSSLHVIGMSLGAHIAGQTGKNIESGKIPRITGLDPAGPLFNGRPPTQRLTKGDAEFIDVVHTNAGGSGINAEIGDVDIWVNGGRSQPGCSPVETMKRIPGSLSELVFCSHYQAYRMYVMSLIDPTAYTARKCSNHATYKAGECNLNEATYLGVDVDVTARGNYYVDPGVTAINL